MSDMQHFANDEQQVWEWLGLSDRTGTTNAMWEPWQKSWVRNYNFLDIFMVGAGAGGGAGAAAAAGNPKGGGGGGSSGGLVTARFALSVLPDVVYFLLPQGALGGTGTAGAGNPGANAIQAHMSARNASITSADLILVTSNSQSGGGSGGTTGAAGPGGSGGSTPTATTQAWDEMAYAWLPRATRDGASGGGVAGSGAVGADALTPLGVISGGAGGAGSRTADFAGGNILAFGQVPQVPGGLAGGGDGGGGLWYRDSPFHPWFASGGAGGGSTNTAATAGGRGGSGAPGCGGGGGGAGTSVGGNGGDGGHSYLLLVVS